MIISRYLLKEVGSALLSVTFILLLVFICNQFVRFLSYAASGKIGPNILLELIGLEIPNLLALLLPLGIYLGIIFSFGRLYADNELRVMHTSGLSNKKVLGLTGAIALGVTLIVAILMLWVNPYIAAEKDKLITQSIAAENIINTLMPGRFQVIGSDKQKVVYVEKVIRNHQEAHNLFFAEQKLKDDDMTANPNKEEDPEDDSTAIHWNVLSASKGYQSQDPTTHDRFVVATEGHRYEGVPGQNDYKIIQFQKYAVRIPDHIKGLQYTPQEVLPTSTLLKHYKNKQNAAELQWRFSIPLSAILLALLAVPLSRTKPRQGRYAHLLPAILIYVVYINLLFVARDWMQSKKWDHPIGMWWVHAGLILLIILIYLLQSGKGFFSRKSS